MTHNYRSICKQLTMPLVTYANAYLKANLGAGTSPLLNLFNEGEFFNILWVHNTHVFIEVTIRMSDHNIWFTLRFSLEMIYSFVWKDTQTIYEPISFRIAPGSSIRGSTTALNYLIVLSKQMRKITYFCIFVNKSLDK